MTQIPGPGPRLDALVAEKVMGWYKRPDGSLCDPKNFQAAPVYRIPEYSTQMGDAWRVVEKLRKDGCDFDFFASSRRNSQGWADAVFLRQADEFLERAATPALAICLTALKAVGFQESNVESSTP